MPFLLRQLGRFFSGFTTPPSVSQTEAFLARLLMAWVVMNEVWKPLNFTTQPSPVGLGHLLDLTWLSDGDSHGIFRAAVYTGLGFYVMGLALPLALPVVTLGHVLYFTLFNSQSFTHHGHQIVSLVLMMQTGVVWWSCARRRFSLGFPDAWINSRILWQSTIIIAGTYVVSVITKMKQSGGKWMWNSKNVAVDIIKTQRQTYYNALDPDKQGDPANALWLLAHPWQARLLFSSGVLLETLSFMALGGRGLAFFIGISLIAMHRSIEELMGGLTFPNNEAMCAIYLINVPFIIAWPIDRWILPLFKSR
jgi:hypothetical protein